MSWFIWKNTEAKDICGWIKTNIFSFFYFFSTSTQRENTHLLGDLVDPVGGTVAEIWALRVPGPTGEHT